jgi:hypothetical protein
LLILGDVEPVLGLTLGLTDGLTDGETEGLMDALGLTDGETEGLMDGLGELLKDGLGEILGLGLTLGEMEGLKDGLAEISVILLPKIAKPCRLSIVPISVDLAFSTIDNSVLLERLLPTLLLTPSK